MGVMVGKEHKTVLGVIMAKGESTRLPGKNLLELGGKSLVELAIEAAQSSEFIDKVVVSSDDEEIGNVAKSLDTKWLRRPRDLCKNDSDISEAALHALHASEDKMGAIDYVVSLQAAVPVRPAGAVDALLREVAKSGAKGGVSMIKRTHWTWEVDKGAFWKSGPQGGRSPFRAFSNDGKYPRSQDIRYSCYEEINSIMVTRRDVCLRGRRWGTPLSIVELPWWAAIDIDEDRDYKEALEAWPFIEAMMRKEANLPTRTFKVVS